MSAQAISPLSKTLKSGINPKKKPAIKVFQGMPKKEITSPDNAKATTARDYKKLRVLSIPSFNKESTAKNKVPFSYFTAHKKEGSIYTINTPLFMYEMKTKQTLGIGHSAKVFPGIATQNLGNTSVVFKLILPKDEDLKKFKATTLKEIDAHKKLQAKAPESIIQLKDNFFVKIGNRFACILVLEKAEFDVQQLLNNLNGIPESTRFGNVFQIAKIIENLHNKDLAWGDISLENTLVVKRGNPPTFQLVASDLANAIETNVIKSKEETHFASPPPESNVSKAGDVWAFITLMLREYQIGVDEYLHKTTAENIDKIKDELSKKLIYLETEFKKNKDNPDIKVEFEILKSLNEITNKGLIVDPNSRITIQEIVTLLTKLNNENF